MEHLLPEAEWQRLLSLAPDPEGWMAVLSQATGVYFFPSREWPVRLVWWLRKVGVTRLLEAGPVGVISARRWRGWPEPRESATRPSTIGKGNLSVTSPATPRWLRVRRSAKFSASAPRRCCMPGLRRASPWRPCSLVTACGILWWRGNRAGGHRRPGGLGTPLP